MHCPVLLDIQHRKYPRLTPSSDFELNAAGAERLRTIRFLTFTPGRLASTSSLATANAHLPVGNLCNCGIELIADKAIRTANGLRFLGDYKHDKSPVWNDEETVELLARASVRDDMKTLLVGELAEDLIEELNEVFFETLYPTYDKGKDV
jgi:hypothetical protein